MGKRKLSKAARFERMFKIWEYLKNNTDKDHPTTQVEMRKSLDEFIGDKETFNRLIKDMARAMNSGEFGYSRKKIGRSIFTILKSILGMMQKPMMRKQSSAVMRSMSNLSICLCALMACITTEPFLMMRSRAS